MKLGVFDHLQKNDRPELSYQDLYARHLDMVEYLDQADFDYYFVAEHHFDLGFAECPSAGAWMAAASQRTKQIRLGPLVYVLPLWHPVRVAEEVAFLDNVTGGRFECGIGSGIGKYAFSAYDASWDEKNDLTWEAYKVLKGMWSNPRFSHQGKYFKVDNAELNIPLVQKPHPPLWMPTRSPESVAAAAAEGFSTVQWCPPKMDVVREIFDYFRETYHKTKPAGPRPKVALMREIYVGETDKRAYEESKEHWIYFWHRVGGGRAYGGYGNENLANITREERKKELLDVDNAIREGSFICGSPETVIAQIQKIARDAGADTFLGEFTFGALEHDKVMKSLKLFAERVMPELKNFAIDALDYPKQGYRVWLKPSASA
jgi:alkanesulfonate monooxygenase SsuD/methylene tetrahydromethanopterin reductase-like flavin-dependent oxidoreductase (luciferase family)